MKVAYFTPLNPMRSGISDFAEEMLPCLAEQMDITLFSDCKPTNPAIRDHFPCFDISQFAAKAAAVSYTHLDVYKRQGTHHIVYNVLK